jgi:alpha-ketoglutarate-dependent 2,4-dichlorophenoxyacetate dioxygenase
MVGFRPLHPLFGVEVSDVDLRAPLDDAAFGAIREAFERHSLLVFHDQELTNEQQVAFTRRFGPLEATKVGTIGAGTEIVVLTNMKPEGGLVEPTHRHALNDKANALWHTDSSFKPIPSLGSALSARIIPPEGGETEYASMRAAWTALPDALKARLEGRVAVHSYAHSRAKVDPSLASQAEKAALPPVRQATVRVHPASGEKAIYLGSHASHIEGMDVEESRRLIDQVMALATEPRFVHTHRWRRHDLVMWDNRCLLHRGRPYDQARHARYMVRTTLAGDAATVAQQAA